MTKLSLLLRESIIYGVGSMMVRSITFVLLPFTTNELSKSQLSELTLIFVTIGILRVLYSHGIGAGFLKYGSFFLVYFKFSLTRFEDTLYNQPNKYRYIFLKNCFSHQIQSKRSKVNIGQSLHFGLS